MRLGASITTKISRHEWGLNWNALTETGGAVFFVERNGDFQRIFDQIARELRSQYSIAYKSTNTTRDGRFRRLRIVPKDSSLVIRSRRGYYAASAVANR